LQHGHKFRDFFSGGASCLDLFGHGADPHDPIVPEVPFRLNLAAEVLGIRTHGPNALAALFGLLDRCLTSPVRANVAELRD
jgi:hypothetical protein